MEPLRTYLRETRTTPKAFAKIIGLDAARFERMLAGKEAIDPGLAQRMVDATGGQKPASIAAAFLAREDRRLFQYVSTHDYKVLEFDVAYVGIGPDGGH